MNECRQVDFAHTEIGILFPDASYSPGFEKNGSDLDSLRHEPTTSEFAANLRFPPGGNKCFGSAKVCHRPATVFPQGEKNCRALEKDNSPWGKALPGRASVFPQGESFCQARAAPFPPGGQTFPVWEPRIPPGD